MSRISRRSFLATSIIGTFAAPALAAPRRVELVDVLGRKVSIRLPVRRALVGMYLEDVAAVAGSDVFDRMAAISTATWRDWKSNQWKAYAAKLPTLAGLADVGEIENKSFSMEKAIAAEPDVAILAAWQVESLGPQINRLEAAGVPVVVVDYNSQTVERHIASTLLIGRIFETEDRARALVTEYDTAVADVRRRVAGSKEPRKRVYLELGNKGPDEYGNTYDKAMWGPMMDAAGADNVAKGKVGNWGPMTAEGVIAAQPEVIFVSGGEWVNNRVALRMGFGMLESDVRSTLRRFAARPGWAEIPAVRGGRMHAVAQGMIRSLHDYTQLQFIAKQLHPDAFVDMDPLANLATFYRNWLPVAPDGVFMLANGASA
jgi:iron complex transport system substrate-binding protein